MKITRVAEKINLNQVMDIPVDVHKDTLCFFFEIGGKEYYDTCANRTVVLDKKLKQYHDIAVAHGRQSLRVICEPTGQYTTS